MYCLVIIHLFYFSIEFLSLFDDIFIQNFFCFFVFMLKNLWKINCLLFLMLPMAIRKILGVVKIFLICIMLKHLTKYPLSSISYLIFSFLNESIVKESFKEQIIYLFQYSCFFSLKLYMFLFILFFLLSIPSYIIWTHFESHLSSINNQLSLKSQIVASIISLNVILIFLEAGILPSCFYLCYIIIENHSVHFWKSMAFNRLNIW